jgi:exopolysaccharide biosynthesis polyprenyl glycosylphosphotransferase
VTVYERFAENHSATPALDIPGFSLEERRVDLPSPFLKRALDISISLIVLVLFAPVLASIALLICLDTQGPVFFCQTRLGLNGKPFDILKFRTMNVLENGDSIRQAHEGDPRITPAGHFLRRLSLDELPQLINVLKGEMSLVGPRPHAVAHDVLYGAAIADYDFRQRVKPGITGWAQVHGLRGPTPTLESMQARVERDIWYVVNRRFLLDVEILFRTVAEVFRSRNAV